MSATAGQILWKLFHSMICLGVLSISSQFCAQSVRADDEIRIITVGDPIEEDAFTEPKSSTVIDRQEMDRRGVINFKDLFRYKPGIEVRRNRRYGIEDINIRGMDGNRILYELNGVRLPERFEYGPFRQTRGQWVDLLNVGQVNVLQGPASVLYGDGALGGVVSFSSLDPEKFLGEDDQAGQAILLLSSENSSVAESLRYAAKDLNGIMTLVSISRSDSEEPHPISDADLINTQDNDSTGFNAQIMIPLSEDIKFRLKALGSRQITRTTIGEGNLPSGQWGYVVNKDKEKIVNQLMQLIASIEFDELMSNPILSGLKFDVYYQDASQVDKRFEHRSTTSEDLERRAKVDAVNQVSGFNLSRKHNLFQGDVLHKFYYGADYSRTFNSRLRDRIQTNLEDGTKTRNLPLGNFPVKDYPDSLTTRLGVFFEDTLVIDSLKLIGGIRYESYLMNPLPDSMFEKEGAVAGRLEEITPTWHLAALWNVDDSHVIWINYNRSFRMPLYSEINSGFTNLNSGYQTVSNPDLKPETGDGIELGLRARHDNVRYSITGYYNLYSNFIEGGRFIGVNCGFEGGRCVAQYQTVNADKAITYGVEGMAEYSTVPGGYGFKIRSGLNYTIGNNLEDDQPLTTIDPPKIIAAIGYYEPSETWSAELIGTAFGRARVPDDSMVYIPSSYIRWDLLGSWSISSKFKINFGILNLFDHKQYSYADTKYILDTGDRDMSGFSMPGRSYQVGFSLRL